MTPRDIELTQFINANSLNASILRSYTEFSRQTCLKEGASQEAYSNVAFADYFMLALNKNNNKLPKEPSIEITPNELIEWDFFPVMTAKGLTCCHRSDPKLHVVNFSFFGDDSKVMLTNGKVQYSDKQETQPTGALFSGSYSGQNVYGYVSLSEAKKLVPASARLDHKVLELIMLETALYRAIYRLNKSGLSQELRDLMTLHELRNFHTFNSTEAINKAYQVAFNTINARKGYLENFSKLWRDNFHQEAMFLSFSLARIAAEYHFGEERIAMESYNLASVAAEKNLSLTPISGELYVSARPCHEKDGVIVLNIYETVRGKLHRAYSYAGLKSVTADVVFSNDNFELQNNDFVTHISPDFTKDSARGELIGAYAALEFVDGTQSNIFIQKKDLVEIALMAGNDAWNDVFFKRMWMKHAISEALDLCDWSPKKYVHHSRYLD
ncbi:recombinase RecT [Vibrio alginolyticus]|uniref:recombinase RecT n=1 Tax=Vibrio alginolyticus TaxID=663 RepID=UPI0022AB4166|nr:recombinase RecT [Vibrio alginolyticus]MCZ2802066.1 recombinase RecT [Vibrio alginolyticus]